MSKQEKQEEMGSNESSDDVLGNIHDAVESHQDHLIQVVEPEIESLNFSNGIEMYSSVRCLSIWKTARAMAPTIQKKALMLRLSSTNSVLDEGMERNW